MGKGKRIVLGTVMTLLAAAVVVLGATVFRLLSYVEETQQTFLQIIVGEKPLDYFDTFVVEWYENGGQELTDSVRKAYSETLE